MRVHARANAKPSCSHCGQQEPQLLDYGYASDSPSIGISFIAHTLRIKNVNIFEMINACISNIFRE